MFQLENWHRMPHAWVDFGPYYRQKSVLLSNFFLLFVDSDPLHSLAIFIISLLSLYQVLMIDPETPENVRRKTYRKVRCEYTG